jgi:phospholipase/lecithinase/hemolysin
MYSENSKADDQSSALVARNDGISETNIVTGIFNVECVGEDGQVKWTETFPNQVTTVGRNDMLDKYFEGSAYTAVWYMGLVDNTSFSTYAAADTLASHSGWLEFLNYTISGSSTNRATISFGTGSAGSLASSATSFTISGAGGTVLGALVTVTQARNTASNGGAGVLYSAGSFTGGARTVVATDTLNVTYTATLT